MDASYLADTVMLLRYFETEGEVRQTISVVKMRSGGHERTLREFSLCNGRITIGEPLREYVGILSGIPEKKSRV
jgi:circadian clock protein KaiC